MKNQTGIWIDTSKAIVVAIQNGKEVVTEIISEIDNPVHHAKEGNPGTFMGDHHLNQERKLEERKKHQTDQFLKKVLAEIKDADEFYITGPSEMKTHLRSKIVADAKLSFKLKAFEPSDHLTLNQLVAKVKQHFKV